ncbi:MAG: D-alanine--D-alanine ligase family protein [Bdellovibrionia bacterium]
MEKQKKIRVLVLYGGKSGEHEISLRSAASVIRHLDRSRFDVMAVGISKSGEWKETDLKGFDPAASSLEISKSSVSMVMGDLKRLAPDVVFPVMHGPLCEDGCIQGLFELAEVAYVGPGVLASAVGMDKEVAKRLVRDAGLPIVPYAVIRHGEWAHGGSSVIQKKLQDLPYPLFVKPANLGSSVGVHKVKKPEQLQAALEDAFRFDSKVLIEQGIDAREIEFAVLENSQFGSPALVSLAGEIQPTHEFYSYEAKYLDDQGAKLSIPASLTPKQLEEAAQIARQAFEVLECEGMARVDLFLDRKTGLFYFNEVNTIPGFTSISMYPKLWEHSGIGYSELLSRLVDLARARHARKQAFVRSYQGESV